MHGITQTLFHLNVRCIYLASAVVDNIFANMCIFGVMKVTYQSRTSLYSRTPVTYHNASIHQVIPDDMCIYTYIYVQLYAHVTRNK